MYLCKKSTTKNKTMKTKNYLVLLLAILFFIANRAVAQQHTSTADSLKNWLNFLASDEMKGRDNGSKEIEKVAKWLSEKYKQYGLQEVAGLKDFVHTYALYGDSSFFHKNIIGYIPAKNEQDNDSSFIVLSAHFDHIGMNRNSSSGDSVYNGADDNASGIVTMLGIAKNLHERNIQLDCPVVFAAFSNEENALSGSSHFCKSNVIPIQKIKVNINFEMCGRTEEFGKNKYFITGPNHSNFQDIVIAFNEGRGWEIANAGGMVNRLFSMADSYSFVEYARRSNACIPAHTIATSIGYAHVHQAHDEIKYVDFDNMNALVDNLTQLVIHVARKNVEVKCNQPT